MASQPLSVPVDFLSWCCHFPTLNPSWLPRHSTSGEDLSFLAGHKGLSLCVPSISSLLHCMHPEVHLVNCRALQFLIPAALSCPCALYLLLSRTLPPHSANLTPIQLALPSQKSLPGNLPKCPLTGKGELLPGCHQHHLQCFSSCILIVSLPLLLFLED